MKQDGLIREIRKAATAHGLTFGLVRSTGPHEVVSPKMAFEIRKECEPELGKGWWV